MDTEATEVQSEDAEQDLPCSPTSVSVTSGLGSVHSVTRIEMAGWMRLRRAGPSVTQGFERLESSQTCTIWIDSGAAFFRDCARKKRLRRREPGRGRSCPRNTRKDTKIRGAFVFLVCFVGKTRPVHCDQHVGLSARIVRHSRPPFDQSPPWSRGAPAALFLGRPDEGVGAP